MPDKATLFIVNNRITDICSYLGSARQPSQGKCIISITYLYPQGEEKHIY